MGFSDSGLENAGGHFGLPSHGSVTIRLPVGSPSRNVEWPSQVMDRAMRTR